MLLPSAIQPFTRNYKKPPKKLGTGQILCRTIQKLLQRVPSYSNSIARNATANPPKGRTKLRVFVLQKYKTQRPEQFSG